MTICGLFIHLENKLFNIFEGMSPDLGDMIVGTHWTAKPSFSGKTLKTEMSCKEYPHLNTTLGGTLDEFVETDHPIFGFGGKSKVCHLKIKQKINLMC
jgi:hypothetical protein